MNRSSEKTRTVIKKVFAEMLAEKRELDKITVMELTERADISRGAFYFHYDDIYAVAEDFENEFMKNFFDNARLLSTTEFRTFIDTFFQYIKENDDIYKLLCKSNDFLFTASKLSTLVANKLFEIFNDDKNIRNKKFLKLEIDVFIEGVLAEYIKYCRGATDTSPEEMYEYTKRWGENFYKRRYTKD